MAKRFVISDETVNEFGFWLKTDGCDLSQFLRNPICLWMHNRAWRGTKDDVLPLGTWKDVRVENGTITGEPVFDPDEFSQQIAAKVESGTLRMASAGVLPIELSEDPVYLKPGQTRATVTKWKLREASICDIGANDNSLALYDEQDNLIKLSGDMNNKKFPSLLNFKTGPIMKKLIRLFSDLADDATEDQVASKVTGLQGENKALQDQLAGYELQHKAALKGEAEALTMAAVKDGRIEAAAKEHFIKMFEVCHDSAKAALLALKPHQKVAPNIGGDAPGGNPLAKLTWDELDRNGELANLRGKDVNLYNEKFKQKFGHEPKKS